MSPDDVNLSDADVRDLAILNGDMEPDPLDVMSERELLVYIAKNVREAVTLIEQGVGALGPILDNPKLKLGMKMFGL